MKNLLKNAFRLFIILFLLVSIAGAVLPSRVMAQSSTAGIPGLPCTGGSDCGLDRICAKTGSTANCTYITCNSGTDCNVNKVCTKPAGDCVATSVDTSKQSCEVIGTSPLTWLACPVLRALDGVAGFLNSQIEGQLNFNASKYLCEGKDITAGQSCNTSPTYRGWSAIRNISTALLVIIMLVMVVSQATGGQFLDAYTIRKALPKLVIAVIAVQLSWPICYYLITLANDAGQGIGSLLYFIFNKGAPITLQTLIGPTNEGLGFGNAAIVGGGILAVYFAFTSIALLIPILIGIVVAIFVLILRQILILACVLMAPIAFVMWILPGTQRYWKLWSDNFTKMLLMFPMIMGLIVAGRVFALLSSGDDPTKTASNFTSFLIVILGYFVPYFMLPQTFKWGGAAMGALGNAANKYSQKFSERPAKFFKGRQEGKQLERAYNSQRRMVNRLRGKKPYEVEGGKYNPLKIGKRAINYGFKGTMDNLRSGVWDPTLGGFQQPLRRVKNEKTGKMEWQRRKGGVFNQKGDQRAYQYQKYISAGRSQIAERGEGFQKIIRGAIEEIGPKGQKADKLYDLYQDAHNYEERMAIMKELASPEVDGGHILTRLKRELGEGKYSIGGEAQYSETAKKRGAAHYTDASTSNTDAFRRVSPHLNEGYAYIPGEGGRPDEYHLAAAKKGNELKAELEAQERGAEAVGLDDNKYYVADVEWTDAAGNVVAEGTTGASRKIVEDKPELDDPKKYELAQAIQDRIRLRDRPNSQLLGMTSAGWQRYEQVYGTEKTLDLYVKLRQQFPTQAGDIAEAARGAFETAFDKTLVDQATGRIDASLDKRAALKIQIEELATQKAAERNARDAARAAASGTPPPAPSGPSLFGELK